jgi:hypothetical protein
MFKSLRIYNGGLLDEDVRSSPSSSIAGRNVAGCALVEGW